MAQRSRVHQGARFSCDRHMPPAHAKRSSYMGMCSTHTGAACDEDMQLPHVSRIPSHRNYICMWQWHALNYASTHASSTCNQYMPRVDNQFRSQCYQTALTDYNKLALNATNTHNSKHTMIPLNSV